MPENDVLNSTHYQWWRDPGMRELYFLLLTCYLGAMSNEYASSLISSLIANPHWFENIDGLPNTIFLGVVVAAHSIGSIVAFFPAPWLSDKCGRRVEIMFGNIAMTAGFLGHIFSR